MANPSLLLNEECHGCGDGVNVVISDGSNCYSRINFLFPFLRFWLLDVPLIGEGHFCLFFGEWGN